MENKRLREQRLYVLGNNGVHRIRVSCAPGLPVLACGCSSLAQLHQQGGELLFIYGADGIAKVGMAQSIGPAQEDGKRRGRLAARHRFNRALEADGCGLVGEVEPITVPELARKAQAVLGGRCNRPRSGPAVQVKFADTGRTVKRLAVISGAGGSMFEDALAVGADCLLTGEANHHAAIDAVRLGLSLVAAGHYATEFPVCAAIADRLRTAFPELEVRVSGENRDPFTYI